MQPQEVLLTVLVHKKPGDTATVTAVNLHGAKHADKVTLGGLKHDPHLRLKGESKETYQQMRRRRGG